MGRSALQRILSVLRTSTQPRANKARRQGKEWNKNIYDDEVLSHDDEGKMTDNYLLLRASFCLKKVFQNCHCCIHISIHAGETASRPAKVLLASSDFRNSNGLS